MSTAQFCCPVCKQYDQRTIDVRTKAEATIVRRRHECLCCHARFTSYAQIDQTTISSVAPQLGDLYPVTARPWP